MLENIHEYMGQTATFTYFERTKAGSYRHPLFKNIRDYEQRTMGFTPRRKKIGYCHGKTSKTND